MKYSVTDQQKKEFAGIYLLEFIINKPKAFALFLEHDESDLEPILEYLLVKGWIQIMNDEKYVPTVDGRLELKKFLEKYSAYLENFDVFCAVDLGAGEFAFQYWDDIEDEEEWERFLNQERWEDMRVAVADYLKMNPVEIVFMSFVAEDRFGRDQTGWQFDLLLGSVWDEILEICNTALQVNDLSYESDTGIVSGENVIQDIIKQGKALVREILQEDPKAFREEINKGDPSDADDEFYVDPVRW